jgi:hypothetical protein
MSHFAVVKFHWAFMDNLKRKVKFHYSEGPLMKNLHCRSSNLQESLAFEIADVSLQVLNFTELSWILWREKWSFIILKGPWWSTYTVCLPSYMKAWLWYYRGSSFEVILGAHRIQENEASQVWIITRETVIHPGWNPLTLANDIALLRLPTKVAVVPGKQNKLVLVRPFYNNMVILLNS